MEELAQVPWAAIAPIIVIQLILMVTALVDIAKSEATKGPKLIWVFISIFISIFGPILYFVIGRKR
ncbi:PLD nuclease N-terminal domain-containing protein [Ferdinandcohnia quinoae]|uniref:PLD nuclease N-terminal domain-containing protein n=1 Tax=Fredinandcohnia quinoae TaxID=2918902 RepID=A0AAW5DXT4_9BACI|nr:PLD nuclease N-terminal domain-containing protein [Fredinandcohnia sp. SECRCQ15]MCH1625163.1 PLD nuclease N-terminal domain-containing protein [Fredinandcohnia sp. SECRCQ15]